MTPAQKLKKWRKSRGYSQVKAAEALDVSLRTYTRWEVDGKPIPKLVELACEALSAKEKDNGTQD